MTATQDTSDFTGKWRAYWPEWRIGTAFVPAIQRDAAAAWFALLQECTTAAWAGDDATPGLAKLAWWNEELLGWAKGASRHPLAVTLQRLPADWAGLASSLRGLQATRGLALQDNAHASGLQHFAAAVATVEGRLFSVATPQDLDQDARRFAVEDALTATSGIVADLLGERALMLRDRAAASTLLEGATPHRGYCVRPRRLQSAYLHARLGALATSGAVEATPILRTLGLSWRAARNRR